MKYQMYAEVVSLIDYSPLWETMEKKRVTQYQLLNAGIDNRTLDSLRKNKKYYNAHFREAVQYHKVYA